MDSVQATFQDGQLRLAQQVDWPEGTVVEVTPLPTNSGWPAGYFEQTAGALQQAPFERASQGETQTREAW